MNNRCGRQFLRPNLATTIGSSDPSASHWRPAFPLTLSLSGVALKHHSINQNPTCSKCPQTKSFLNRTHADKPNSPHTKQIIKLKRSPHWTTQHVYIAIDIDIFSCLPPTSTTTKQEQQQQKNRKKKTKLNWFERQTLFSRWIPSKAIIACVRCKYRSVDNKICRFTTTRCELTRILHLLNTFCSCLL